MGCAETFWKTAIASEHGRARMQGAKEGERARIFETQRERGETARGETQRGNQTKKLNLH